MRGEIRLNPQGTMPDGLKGYTRFYAGRSLGEAKPLSVKEWRFAGDALLLTIAGISDRDAVARLTNWTLFVERGEMPALKEGEYYHTDLIGASVFDTGGLDVGKVEDVLDWGDYDMLVIRSGKKSWMLPVIAQYVVEIDSAGGRVVVDAPEGLKP